MSAYENNVCPSCRSKYTEWHRTRALGTLLKGYRVCLICKWVSDLEPVCETCLGSGREYVDLEHLGHFYKDCHCKGEE